MNEKYVSKEFKVWQVGIGALVISMLVAYGSVYPVRLEPSMWITLALIVCSLMTSMFWLLYILFLFQDIRIMELKRKK